MDPNILIGSIQVALAAFQLKLDHFKKPARQEQNNDLNNFYDLGEAIRILEYALSETVSFVGQSNDRRPNPRLASLWEDASRSVRRVNDSADLADLMFEKNLYWRNPEFYHGRDANRLYHISLDNVLTQLRKLRTEYDKVQRKLSEGSRL